MIAGLICLLSVHSVGGIQPPRGPADLPRHPGIGQAPAAAVRYAVSFPNAVHHEALIEVRFVDVTTDTLSVRMSRSSPGRYALHEFVKNAYGLEALDGEVRMLWVRRPDPFGWTSPGTMGPWWSDTRCMRIGRMGRTPASIGRTRI